MGDRRYERVLRTIKAASDRGRTLRQLGDEEIIQALAAFSASGERDPYLANVLATEAMNRVHRSGLLARTAAEALVSLDPSGRVTDANPAALRALGIARGAFVGRHYHEHLHLVRDDGSRVPLAECPIQRVLETERPFLAREVRLQRADGTTFDALLSVSRIHRGEAAEGAVVLFIDITERKRTEEISQQERQRLYRILDNVTEGIVLIDPDGRFEYANPSAQRLLGLDEGDLAGSFAFEDRLFDLDGRKMPTDALPSREAMRTRSPVRGRRFYVERRDGTRVAIETDAAPILGEHGELDAVVISFDDVTQRLRDEERAALLASIVENTDDAVLLETLEGTIREWNAAAGRLLGYSLDEVAGRHVSMLIPPDRQDEVENVNGRVARGEKVPTFETERLAKDGTRIPVSLTVSAVRDRSGRIVALSAIYRDIRRLVAKRKRIAESEERYRSLFENDPSPVFTIDESGNLVEANPAGEALIGYRIAELKGSSFAPLLAPGDVERALVNFARVLEGEARTDEYSVLRKDGRMVRVRVTALPVKIGGRIVGVHGRAQRIDDASPPASEER